MKPENRKDPFKMTYTLILLTQYGIQFWHELAYTPFTFLKLNLNHMRHFRLLSLTFDLHCLSELYLGTYPSGSNIN